jgi:hypothetical protein
MLTINPQHARPFPLQAHLVLETRSCFRLILYWTRLFLSGSQFRSYNVRRSSRPETSGAEAIVVLPKAGGVR